MATFVSANFTGIGTSELSAFDSNWTKHTSYTPTIVGSSSYSGYVTTANYSDISLYYHSGSPSSADYTVEGTFLVSGPSNNGSSGFAAVVGRVNSSANTFYMARLSYAGSLASSNWQLFRAVSGSFAQLGSNSSVSISADTDYTIKLEMDGDSISLYGNGAGTPTITQTDTNISPAGNAGVRVGRPGDNGSATSGNPYFKNLTAVDLGLTATSHIPRRAARFHHMMVR